MLNFKGKMYKLCEKKDMDRKPKSKPVEVDRKIRSDKGGKHAKAKPKPEPRKARKAVELNKYDKDGKLIPYRGSDKKKAPTKKDVKKVLAKVKKNMKAPAKKAPAKKAPAKAEVAKKAPAKKKKKKFNVVEGFPSFKGDEPRAKEEKRRDNSLY